MYSIKKGAMFGLDARIALAIFGALSVISGAALYSAIQESKVTSLLTEMQEIAKASEAYLLDTGVYIPSQIAGSNLTVANLIEDTGVTGWKGPYLSYEEGSSGNLTLAHPVYGDVQVIRARDNTWSTFSSAEYKCLKADAVSCSVTVLFTTVPLDILKALEEKIDGTAPSADEDFSGKFRFTSAGFAMLLALPYDKKQAFN
jgi:hypothetical protein